MYMIFLVVEFCNGLWYLFWGLFWGLYGYMLGYDNFCEFEIWWLLFFEIGY